MSSNAGPEVRRHQGPDDRSPKKVAFFGLVALSVMGPYLTFVEGVRLEHILIYGGVALLGPFYVTQLRSSPHLLTIIGLWLSIVLVSLIGLIAVPRTGALVPGSLAAGLDNLLMPLAVILFTQMLLTASGASRVDALTRATMLIAACGVANALVALISTQIDLTGALSAFHGSPDIESVATRAQQLGRFSGIFNQPAEAGLFYSIALLSAIYALRHRQSRLVLVSMVIFIGGALSVSKVFLLIGAPVGAFYLVRFSAGRQKRIVALTFTAIVMGLAGTAGFFQQWSGAQRLRELFAVPTDGLLNFYTAERFGSGGSIARDGAVVLEESPWLGFGVRGLEIPYDTQWLEMLVVAGLVGAVLTALVYVTLFMAWRRSRTWQSPPESALGLGLIVVAAASSLGLPTLTANRAAVLLWLLLVLTVLADGRTLTPRQPHVPLPNRSLSSNPSANRSRGVVNARSPSA